MHGHETNSIMDLVLKLKKSLYGLVQAPRYLFDKISSEISLLGFKPSELDQCIFYK